ncbi:MAG: hypothetical protein J0I20_18355 [Chloroflexi bacterium]|nr:hypothetical protein [Chloroflexota bacterium]OJV86879.1 MAG: hypothetical protein BGO39_13740 [Chloroflexi bacterium 54-19]
MWWPFNIEDLSRSIFHPHKFDLQAATSFSAWVAVSNSSLEVNYGLTQGGVIFSIYQPSNLKIWRLFQTYCKRLSSIPWMLKKVFDFVRFSPSNFWLQGNGVAPVKVGDDISLNNYPSSSLTAKAVFGRTRIEPVYPFMG